MITFVLDASVAIKWAMPLPREPLMDESLRLLKRYIAGEVDFIVPDVFWAELGSVLWKGVRQRRWKRDEAENIALVRHEGATFHDSVVSRAAAGSFEDCLGVRPERL